MKRDQSIPLTYIPPRARVVDAYAESAILQDSKKKFNSLFSVDELESKGYGDEDEQYWFE